MKRFAIIFSLILIVCCSSCTLKESVTDDVEKGISVLSSAVNSKLYDEISKIDPETYGRRISEKLVKAFEEKDKAAIKELFSDKAINECTDFDGYLENALKYYNQKNAKITIDNPTESHYTIDGEKVVRIGQEITVLADNVTMFYFLAYPIDDTDPSNIGIWSMCISNEKYIGSEAYTEIMENIENRSGIFVVPKEK